MVLTGRELAAFLGSRAFLLGLLAATMVKLPGAAFLLTAENAAAGPTSL